MNHNRYFWAALPFSILAVGCGTQGAGHGPDFPSQASLNDLAGRPAAAAQNEDRKTVAVDDWQPADDNAPTTEAEALTKRAVAAKGRAAKLDAELGCAAREVARFYAQHAAFPDQQLQAYMAGVCGSTQETFSVSVWSESNASVASADRQKQWHDQIATQLGQWLPADAKQIGAAELSDGKTSVFAIAVGTSDVAWESHSPVTNDAGEVELSGSLRTSAAFIFGYSNIGAYGAHECRSDPRVALPRFHITCQLDPADTSAWIDLEALPAGHVLAQGIARVLMRRPGTALSFTAATKNVAPESVTTATDFAKRLFTLVNEKRAEAQMPPLKLATRESETSARLAAHYFETESAAELADEIALGLTAGWDIQGNTIRNGNFYSNNLSGSLDPRRWLGFMLEQPAARRVILDPQARAIAIGPELYAKSQTVGALVSTYQFYDSDDHQKDVERFISRLNERRQGLGLAPATITQAPEVGRAVQSVKTNHDPEAALQTAMQQVVSRTQHGVQGYYIEATDIDHVNLPEALLRPQVTLAISAAHHRYPDAAWGTLTLLVVVMESSGAQKTAAASAQTSVQ